MPMLDQHFHSTWVYEPFINDHLKMVAERVVGRRDVPVGAPLDLSTPTGMNLIGTYGENFKTDNVSKYHVLLFAFLLL